MLAVLMLGLLIVFLTMDSYNFDKERHKANTNWKEIDRLLKTGRWELIFTPNLGLPLLKLKDTKYKRKEKIK